MGHRSAGSADPVSGEATPGYVGDDGPGWGRLDDHGGNVFRTASRWPDCETRPLATPTHTSRASIATTRSGRPTRGAGLTCGLAALVGVAQTRCGADHDRHAHGGGGNRGCSLLTNQSLRATNGQYGLSQQNAFIDRFRLAAEQLASDKINVRLSGVYLLERLADDSPNDYETVFAVIAAFVRTQAPAAGCPNQDDARPVDIEAALTTIGRRSATRDRDTDKIDLHATCLARARLKGANLFAVDLTGANLNGADLDEANLGNADLTNANLATAHLDEANLNGAHLVGANLSGVGLTGADLTGADLGSTNLAVASMRNANLTRANLSGATLPATSLRDADLNGADLSFTKLTSVDWSGRTSPARDR